MVACGAPAVGVSTLYTLDILNGAGAGTAGARTQTAGSGIAGEVVLVFRPGGVVGLIPGGGTTGGGPPPPGCVGSACGSSAIPLVSGLPRYKTTWRQE